MSKQKWIDYHRCSTEEQYIEGYSIETQNKFTKEIINKMDNIEYVGNYVDAGFSGSDSMDKRPDILRLLKDAKNKEFDGLVIYKADRLGRIADEREYVIQLLNKYGIKIVCYSGENLTDNSPQGVFMRKTLANIDELEVRTLSYRIKNTMRFKASEGQWKGGRPPYGYVWDKENQIMIQETPQIEQVKIVWGLYLNQLQGYNKIRDYFNLELKQPYYKNGNPEPWNKWRVKSILNSPLYAGYQYHNTKYSKFELSEGKHRKPKEEWELYPAKFLEPIITLEEFNKAQNLKKKKTSHYMPSVNTSWLLTGLLYCGHCGENLTGHPHYNKYKTKSGEIKSYDCSSYICSSRDKKGKINCSSKQVVKKRIEKTIEEKILDFVKKLKNYDIKEIKKILYKQVEEDFNNGKNLENQLNQINKNVNKYYKDYEKGDIEANILNFRIKELNIEKEMILQEIKTFNETNKTKELLYQEIEIILNNISNWDEDYFKQDSIGSKKVKIMELIDRIYIKDDEINIIYKFNPSYVGRCSYLQEDTPEHISKKAINFINETLIYKLNIKHYIKEKTLFNR